MVKDGILSRYKNIWASRLPAPAWVIVIAFLPSCSIVVLLTLQPWVPLSEIVRDPTAVINTCLQTAGTLAGARDCNKSYFGFLSNLGILVWCTSAAICLFSFLQIYLASGRIQLGVFLLYAGVFTGVLLIDDLFMLHEFIRRHFGVVNEVVYAVYFILIAIYLIAFQNDLLKCDCEILLISLTLFSVSILVDIFVHNESVIHWVAEDGSKFIAIWAWAIFHLRAVWLTCERVGTLATQPTGQRLGNTAAVPSRKD